MKRWLAAIVVVLLVVPSSFWFYNVARTMREGFGFSLYEVLRSGLVTMIPFAGAALIAILVRVGLLRKRVSPGVAAAFVVSCVVGIASGEAWVLQDESHFSAEVRQVQASSDPEFYSRGRCWPNTAAELVYQRGHGIHATD